MPRHFRFSTGLLPIFFAMALLVGPRRAPAQGKTTAAILGEVTDTTNAAVPGATVTVVNRDTGVKRIVRTDASCSLGSTQSKQWRRDSNFRKLITSSQVWAKNRPLILHFTAQRRMRQSR